MLHGADSDRPMPTYENELNALHDLISQVRPGPSALELKKLIVIVSSALVLIRCSSLYVRVMLLGKVHQLVNGPGFNPCNIQVLFYSSEAKGGRKEMEPDSLNAV